MAEWIVAKTHYLLAALLDTLTAPHHLIHSLLDVGRVKVVLLNQLGPVVLEGVELLILGQYKLLKGIVFLHLQEVKSSLSSGEVEIEWSAS